MGHHRHLVVEIGHHIPGQAGPGQLGDVLALLAAGVDTVNPVSFRVKQAGHLFHGGDAVEHGLDLTQLDAVAHVLDLPVAPGEEIEQAVLALDGEVAGLIENIAEIGIAGILDEDGVGLFRVAEVAAGDASAADTDLTRLAGGNGLPVLAEQQDLRKHEHYNPL